MSKIKLINGDCLKVMDKMIAKEFKVDCIITSPPYNMNVQVCNGRYRSRCANKDNKEEFSHKYDHYTDDLSLDEYFEFQKSFIEKALEISDLVFYNTQMVSGNKPVLFKLLGEFAYKIKEVIIWDKCYGQPAMQQKVMNSQYEYIFVFQNSKPYYRSFDVCNFERGTETNLWQIKRERNKLIKAGFPTELIRRILKNFTNEGQTILDPFMGSGTTGVVCKEMNRNFIGIELAESCFSSAKERLEK